MPAKSIYVAAGRWLDLLQFYSIEEATARTRTLPTYRDLTPSQYAAGLDLLSTYREPTQRGPSSLTTAKEQLLSDYFTAEEPLWLETVGSTGAHNLNAELLPLDLVDMGKDFGLSSTSLATVAGRASGKFDAKRLSEIGLAGEELFFKWLSSRSHARIEHTSKFDDGAGFDIEAWFESQRACFEVKSSTQIGSTFTFYLSRNEYQVMQILRDLWSLQLVQMPPGRPPRYGYVENAWLQSQIPSDSSPLGRWNSVRITVPENHFCSGLSPSADWCIAKRMAR